MTVLLFRRRKTLQGSSGGGCFFLGTTATAIAKQRALYHPITIPQEWIAHFHGHQKADEVQTRHAKAKGNDDVQAGKNKNEEKADEGASLSFNSVNAPKSRASAEPTKSLARGA
jgi:hypothetical protein